MKSRFFRIWLILFRWQRYDFLAIIQSKSLNILKKNTPSIAHGDTRGMIGTYIVVGISPTEPKARSFKPQELN